MDHIVSITEIAHMHAEISRQVMIRIRHPPCAGCAIPSELADLALSAKVSAAERALSATETPIASANPRKLLERGYTLVSDASGRLVKNSAGVNSGDKIDIHFPDGTINCTVNGKALPAPAPGTVPPSAP